MVRGGLGGGGWRLAGFVVVVGLSTGCWQKAEREMVARVGGMEGHLLELFDAADAVRDSDTKGYRQAMKALGHVPELPGVDPAQLEAVRSAATVAASMESRGQQAEALVGVAGACVSCHTQLGGDAPPMQGLEGDAATLALAAYVWRDDGLWTRAGSAAHDAGAPWPSADPPWPQRGAVVTRLLTR